MKKSTLTTLVNYLSAHEIPELNEVFTELSEELNKQRKAAEDKLTVYDTVKPIVLAELAAGAATCAELYEMCKDKVPAEFTKGKLSYALRNYWTDSVNSLTPGSRQPTIYQLKAE